LRYTLVSIGFERACGGERRELPNDGLPEGEAVRRIAVWASGTGTTLRALDEACRAGEIGAEVALVVSDRDCGAVEYARGAGLTVVSPGEAEYVEVDLHVLAGYLRLVPESLLMRFPRINTHPALLPAYGGKGMYGLAVHRAVLAAGETETGVTVHYVDAQYDHGETIAQVRLPVLPGDTPESLRERVQAVEKPLLIRTVAQLLESLPA
jgi:folate-dependent phosphoribosylglycinamide formyltransferase PurN